MAKPLTFLFKDDGAVPNNRLPALVYKAALDLSGESDPEGALERLFAHEQLGPRAMARRHLSVHALSFDDP